MKFLSLIILAHLFYFGCTEAPEISNLLNNKSDVTGAYDATKGWKIIQQKKPLSAFLIDESILKVNGAQVGLQDYLSYETPVISFFLPSLADYIEIIRCPASVNLTSRQGKLLHVEATARSVDELSSLLREVDFWKQAQDSSKCTLISSNYSTSLTFHDESASSGSIYYLLRACVNPSRLADAKVTGKRNCSRQVGVTMTLDNYTNKRDEKLISAIASASQEKHKMDALGRSIYTKTIELNNQLFECEKREVDRQIRLTRKAAISNIIGLGLSIGASIYGANLAAPDMSSMDIFKSVWESKDSVAGFASTIGGTIMDLTSSPDDFPRSCSEQEKILTELQTLVTNFKLSHQKYATLLASVGR